MATFSSNPVEQQSPYGDGRYLLRMLLGDRTAPTPDMAPPMEEQAIAPPRNLTPLASDVYVDDPASNAEINPLAPASTGRSKPPVNTQPNTPPIPQAKSMQADPGIPNIPQPAPVNHGLYNVPQAKPSITQALSPSQQGVSDIMDNMRTMLDGNSASAGQAINGIDGNTEQTDDSGWGWGDTAKAIGIAALIAAILTGRGRSASGVADSVGTGRSVAPYDPGMSGTILGRDAISGPQASGPSPAQIETDILSVTPNELPRAQTGVATRPNDAPVAQGKPQSVAPDVINQSGPSNAGILAAPQSRPTAAASAGRLQNGAVKVRYRGRDYTVDRTGAVYDRNGDEVNASITDAIRDRAAQM